MLVPNWPILLGLSVLWARYNSTRSWNHNDSIMILSWWLHVTYYQYGWYPFVISLKWNCATRETMTLNTQLLFDVDRSACSQFRMQRWRMGIRYIAWTGISRTCRNTWHHYIMSVAQVLQNWGLAYIMNKPVWILDSHERCMNFGI